MSNLQNSPFPIRLNKFISTAGICSRRTADKLIQSGSVKINNLKVLDPFYRVQNNDVVVYEEKIISLPAVREYFYVVLNKPKDYLVTNSDPQGRKNVFDLLPQMDTTVRLFQVGRLDRNTTGVILFTNDGILANKLIHPSHQITKIYKATLDKSLSTIDLKKLLTGVPLPDGPSFFDSVSFFDNTSKNQILVNLHSGKNRIIRRTFECLNYSVKHLDRISFAGIEKKNLKPGKWRFLDPEEILHLKQLCSLF